MSLPFDELRKAAERIRKVAGQATPGPWCGEYTYTAIRHVARNCDIDCDAHSDRDDCGRFGMYDGPHIALWDPTVALLVADILAIAAVSAEAMQWQNSREGDTRTRVLPSEFDVAALALARAINKRGDS